MYLRAFILLPSLLSLTLPVSVAATDFSELYRKADPSVVVLHTFTTSPTSGELKSGIGSGVLISAEGLVATAAHVVHTADSVHVELQDGTKVIGKVIASEPAADLALLQLEPLPENLVFSKLADSDNVQVGNEIFVIGAPYGLNHTLTVGHISSRHPGHSLGRDFLLGEFFQTDAAINRGNSGGPVFNLQGEVIGIVSHIESVSGGNEGLGFAVTSNIVKSLMLERRHYWSGIQGVPITPALATAINFPLDHGLLLQKVAEGSFAANIGLRGGQVSARFGKQKVLLGGDILVSIAGIPLRSEKSRNELRMQLDRLTSGEKFKIQIFRLGILKTIEVEIP